MNGGTWRGRDIHGWAYCHGGVERQRRRALGDGLTGTSSGAAVAPVDLGAFFGREGAVQFFDLARTRAQDFGDAVDDVEERGGRARVVRGVRPAPSMDGAIAYDADHVEGLLDFVLPVGDRRECHWLAEDCEP